MFEPTEPPAASLRKNQSSEDLVRDAQVREKHPVRQKKSVTYLPKLFLLSKKDLLFLHNFPVCPEGCSQGAPSCSHQTKRSQCRSLQQTRAKHGHFPQDKAPQPADPDHPGQGPSSHLSKPDTPSTFQAGHSTCSYGPTFHSRASILQPDQTPNWRYQVHLYHVHSAAWFREAAPAGDPRSHQQGSNPQQ